ncbi:RNA-directed DNA polymerase [bacterium]|nr:RNA-directed DNA polymerase [bacterium]
MGFLDWLAGLFGGGPTESGGRSWGVFEPPPPRERRKKLRATAHHDPDRLAAQDLPSLRDCAELAGFLGISPNTLRWLTHVDEGDEPEHYVAFAVPKRSGDYRVLYAPKAKLKQAQRRVYDAILSRVPLPDAAHGFVPKRSILTNAEPHAEQYVVMNVDLQDFFPSITYRRVRGIFQALGYGEEAAIPLALLCTVKPAGKLLEYMGHVRHRQLPQGAPTSPALANLACRRLDARLGGLARAFGATYTRYADDLTFSGDDAFSDALGRFVRHARTIIADEGFRVNARKVHIARKGRRQQVTGLVVNDAPSVPRRYRRELRAILHNARTTGLDAQNRHNHPDFARHLRGRIAFVRTTHPGLADQLQRTLDSLL